jgi:sRNA-binding carbon storage regulator CsrA
MLKIRRKHGESLLLHLPDGRTVRVKVERGTTTSNVYLVIDAPRDVGVSRPDPKPCQSDAPTA